MLFYGKFFSFHNFFIGNDRWNNLEAPIGDLYPWDKSSTYIKNPPFFDGMKNDLVN